MTQQAHPDDIKSKPLTPEDDYLDYITADLEFGSDGQVSVTEQSLNSVLKYQARLYREIEAFEAEAKRQKAQIDEWLDSRTHALKAQREKAKAQLEDWARANRTEHKKSWSVTAGTVSTRAGEDKLEVTDKDALIKDLLKKKRMDLLKLNPSAADIKTAIKDDGELFDGVSLEAGEPTVSFKFKDLEGTK